MVTGIYLAFDRKYCLTYLHIVRQLIIFRVHPQNFAMKKKLLLLILVALHFHQPICQTLYSNTVSAGFLSNPGLGTAGTPRIFFDDVLIPSALVQGSDSVSITKVIFGVLRAASAPAVTIELYYSVVDDTATTINTVVSARKVKIKTLALPQAAPIASRNIIYVGDSINTLFKIKTDTGHLYTGYQTFFLGISFSNNSAMNGWELTIPGPPESENNDVLWVYDGDRPQPRYATNFGGGNNPSATFYLQVFGKGTAPLAVTLSDFNARASGNNNLLTWTTQQESNIRHFEIERSNDALHFSRLGEVAAAGNSNIVHTYSFADPFPPGGSNYYRLRTVSEDGTSQCSRTCLVKNESSPSMTIYPNPVQGKISVSIYSRKPARGQMIITDAGGNVIYRETVSLWPAKNTFPVALNNIKAGFYIVKIQTDNEVLEKKFLKL